MRLRIYSSLGNLTPAEFESQWRAQQQVLRRLTFIREICVQGFGRSTLTSRTK